MSTKIFPFKRINPTKGRATIGLPDRPPPNREEREIMRQLIAEEAEKAREKRAAALPQKQAAPETLPISVWAFEPEYVMAYTDLANRQGKRRYRPATRRAFEAAATYLDKFKKGEKCHCEACKTDITSTKPGERVPYGIFVWSYPGAVQASGLCRDCTHVRLADHGEWEDGRKAKITVIDWMSTVHLRPSEDKLEAMTDDDQ